MAEQVKYMKRGIRRLVMRGYWYPHDVLSILILCGYAFYILIAPHRFSGWGYHLLGYILGISAIVMLAVLESEHAHPVLSFFHITYPLYAYAFLYWESGRLLHIFRPHLMDYVVQGWERMVFGVPWLGLLFPRSTVLSEFLHFGYLSYFLLIGLTALYLLLTNRMLLIRYVFGVSLTFYCCYLFFDILPAAGPRFFYLVPEQILEERGFFTYFVRNILFKGAIDGGAFPSSHVAVAWVVWFYLRRAIGWKALWFLPVVFLLIGGTVYGGYHYAVDVIAGTVVGLTLYKLGALWYPRFIRWISHHLR